MILVLIIQVAHAVVVDLGVGGAWEDFEIHHPHLVEAEAEAVGHLREALTDLDPCRPEMKALETIQIYLQEKEIGFARIPRKSVPFSFLFLF